MKLDEKLCKYCFGKRFYTVLHGIHSTTGDELPSIHRIACSRCNKNNRRKIKNVRPNWWS